jgi:hypothetical protein
MEFACRSAAKSGVRREGVEDGEDCEDVEDFEDDDSMNAISRNRREKGDFRGWHSIIITFSIFNIFTTVYLTIQWAKDRRSYAATANSR